MSLFTSTRRFEDFFDDPANRHYEKYRTDPRARRIFEWLKVRLDWLISSVTNHRRPALQGVIVDLEDLLIQAFGWTPEDKENFFITMIGAMVRFLLEEHGIAVKRTGVPLRYNRIITTAAMYNPPVPAPVHH